MLTGKTNIVTGFAFLALVMLYGFMAAHVWQTETFH
jgi:hypothetical protein